MLTIYNYYIVPLFSPYIGPEPYDNELILALFTVTFVADVVVPSFMAPITPPHALAVAKYEPYIRTVFIVTVPLAK